MSEVPVSGKFKRASRNSTNKKGESREKTLGRSIGIDTEPTLEGIEKGANKIS